MSALKWTKTGRYVTHMIFVMIASITFLSSKALMPLPAYNMGLIQWTPFPSYDQIRDSRHLNQKWYVTKYTGVSAGFGFFNGGSATVVSAPIGLQVNRQITNNLIAFAGAYVAPTFYSFNNTFANPNFNKSYPGNNFNQYGFGINPGLRMGLMYVNDARTFSISGSINVERSSYPYPAYPVQ